MIPLSILDLAPIVEGGDAAQAFKSSADLAHHAEALGYNRYWLAEHHNFPGIASAATAVVIGHVAAATTTIRIGAGGVMLPNHAPLVIAEQFGTLATLFPGRIDLGLGRAPGTDMLTAQALRRSLAPGGADSFPNDVAELIRYFEPEQDGQRVRAVPGVGTKVPVWILGSSTYGAQLAAMMGLPYAFASHFAPADLDHAIAVYRDRFTPSKFLDRPCVMPGLNVTAAETDKDARLLFSSVQQAVVNLRTGRPGKLPPPVEGYEDRLGDPERSILDHALSCAVVGSPATVKAGLEAFLARTGADELMITGQIFDHAARLRSFEIVAQAAGLKAQ
jgi:luciferase family oxidoreductase group 1